jgi:hypothetical protein
MDSFSSGAVGATSVIVLGILYKVYQAVNHHRIRSNCCGNKIEASIDIDETTPKTNPVIVRDERTNDRTNPERDST